ncbi:MAG: 30S ribosomal protein S17 [Deltaproteobacteria bacterium]|nr:30S ribosomal protein S17 [Deltaproteobacteria bacterium]
MEKQQPKKVKKTEVGRVVGAHTPKTVAVEITRRVMDPQFKKYITRNKKFLVHDEEGKCKLNDWVRIHETRPISKRKSWAILEILEREEA